jgi:hypothetical protein
MADQLALIDVRPTDWRLDERTIERGKEGVRNARLALRESVKRAEKRRAAEQGAQVAA